MFSSIVKDGNSGIFESDRDGLLKREVDYSGICKKTEVSADALTATQTTPAGIMTLVREASGRATTQTDALGTTSYSYDDRGRLLSVVGPQATIEYTLDEFGRATTETVRLVTGESSSCSVDVDHTDTLRAEHVTLPSGDRFSTRYEHNEFGEVVSSVHTHTPAHALISEEVATLGYGIDERGNRNRIATDSLIRTIATDYRGRTVTNSLAALDPAVQGGLRTVSSRAFSWRADNVLETISDYLRGVITFNNDSLGRAVGVIRDSSAASAPHWPSEESNGGSSHKAGYTSPPAQIASSERYRFTLAGVLAAVGAPVSSQSTQSLGAVSSSTTGAQPAIQSDELVDLMGTLPIRVGKTSYTYDASNNEKIFTEGRSANSDCDEIKARFIFVMPGLTGSPRELVDPHDGAVLAYAAETLYGKRTWHRNTSSPLLYVGQYLDSESGWAYNRYRYYHPHAGIYNAQDLLGVAPCFASAQAYVDHPAVWIHPLGLKRGPCFPFTPRDIQTWVGPIHVAPYKDVKGHHVPLKSAINTTTNARLYLRLPSFSGHPTCTDVVSVGEDVHCESTTQEVHAGVPA